MRDVKTTQALVQQIKILEDFSLNSNRYFLLFDLITYLPVYVSNNIINQGYTQQEFYELDFSNIEKYLYKNHLTFLVKFRNWKKRFYQAINESCSAEDRFVVCGLKLKNKWNQVHSLIIKGKMMYDEFGQKSSLYFLELEVVSKLHNSNLYWVQYLAHRNEQTYSRVYFSSGPKKEASQLLTSTELKVLNLIAKNYASSTIATELGIEVETVKRHRKNILAKTKVKDLTSLIQLLTICDML